ncbi:MAG: GNAT family N-acetyltransferase [Candidatus Aminicenantes bacterium]|nr:GNAT family N-acetyltransferase [Candidatus Aminicenantes bacterium]
MNKTTAVNIRVMTPADIDFATGLTHAAGWASESLDVFTGFLEHDAPGCFIAEAGGEKAGVCIATKYVKNGFIGELVVSQHMRLLAIGQMLFKKALDHLLAAGLENIYLDGDLNAVSYYESMGFRKVCRSLRFRGRIKGKKHAHLRHANPGDLEQLCDLDRELFGDDRGFFLRRRVENYPGLCLVCEQEGRLRGWIMARPGDGLLAIGPWAALAGNEEAASLLEQLASENSMAAFRIGVLEKNTEAVRLLRSWPGLQETIHSWFMVRGKSDRLGNHPALYAVGSGAKG